jgi:2-C-methyl-D-erythritol 4-phosphate cytidylyltransferase
MTARRRAPRRSVAVAIVPAGGAGTRLGSRVPKQYLAVGGTPLLVRTVRLLARAPSIAGVVVAAPAPRVETTRALLRRHRLPRSVTVVAGGTTRQDSVRAGLEAAPGGIPFVLVHDAVRPFIGADLVERVLAAARRWGAATCGLPVRETVKRVRGETVEATVDREGLWLVQTPQGFRRELLCRAHEAARRDGFAGTDDAVLVERLGERVAMVPGLAQNMKITSRIDLALARRWARPRRAPGRSRA